VRVATPSGRSRTSSRKSSRVKACVELGFAAVCLSVSAFVIATNTPMDAIVRSFFYPILTGSTEAKPALLLAHLGLMSLAAAVWRGVIKPPFHPDERFKDIVHRTVKVVNPKRVAVLITATAALSPAAQTILEEKVKYGLRAGTLVVITGGRTVGETTCFTHSHAVKACVGKVLAPIIQTTVGAIRFHYGETLARYVPYWMAIPVDIFVLFAYVTLGFIYPFRVYVRTGSLSKTITASFAGFLAVLGAVDGGIMGRPLIVSLCMYAAMAAASIARRRGIGPKKAVGLGVLLGLVPLELLALVRIILYHASPMAPNTVAWAVFLVIASSLAWARGE